MHKDDDQRLPVSHGRRDRARRALFNRGVPLCGVLAVVVLDELVPGWMPRPVALGLGALLLAGLVVCVTVGAIRFRRARAERLLALNLSLDQFRAAHKRPPTSG